MKLQTFSANWKKMTGGCELKGLIYGRHRVLFFLLFLGPNSLAIYSLSPLFFSSSSILSSSLSSKTLQEGNFQVSLFIFYWVGSGNLGLCSQVQLRASCRHSACLFALLRAGSLAAASAPLHTCAN